MKCCVCKSEIPSDRVEGLMVLGVSEYKATCIEHATNTKVRGIYLGESGLSPLIIADNLGEHGVFREEQLS